MNTWARLSGIVKPQYFSYLADIEHPLFVQCSYLQKILHFNQKSAFGLQYDFKHIKDPDSYRSKVPIHSYQDLHPEFEHIANGDNNRLFCSKPVVFEKTGGSLHGTKYIPYTTESLNAFQSAIYPWFSNLIIHRPRITRGSCFWAINPIGDSQSDQFGHFPVGTINDVVYFGPLVGKLVSRLSVVPDAVRFVNDKELWTYLTLRFLVDRSDLSLISIWSPTFLITLLQKLPNYAQQLVVAVAKGVTGSVFTDINNTFDSQFRPNLSRAKILEKAVQGNRIDTKLLWPLLDMISCWKDATARSFATQLKHLFPHALIQGKGLLSTEGVVSIPLIGFKYPIMAIKSAFIEFVDKHNQSFLCEELTEGKKYRLLLTTIGGLYRYDTGDLVRMRGYAFNTPMLEFVGRSGVVADLCGEKLTEEFVLNKLSNLEGFVMISPSKYNTPHYVLYLDADLYDKEGADQIAHKLDMDLRENPQYDSARFLGQLGTLQAKRVLHPVQTYQEHVNLRGKNLADVKPSLFYSDINLDKRFTYC